MLNKKFLGVVAELYVLLFYCCRLYFPIVWRFKRHKVGEIDWILRRGKSLVFIEVKFRKSKFDIDYLVRKDQRNRIIKMSQIFLKQNPAYQTYNLRFDIALVNNFSIVIFHNAWMDFQ